MTTLRNLAKHLRGRRNGQLLGSVEARHPYELVPTAAELDDWLDTVTELGDGGDQFVVMVVMDHDEALPQHGAVDVIRKVSYADVRQRAVDPPRQMPMPPARRRV